MTNSFITNATWAISGQKVHLQLGKAGNSVKLNADTAATDQVRGMIPAEDDNLPEGMRTIDATGKLSLPALFDLHTHIEIPGRSKRECIMRAGEAAIHGGVWGMLVLPSSSFCFDNSASLDSFREAVEARSAAEMVPCGCITLGMQGEQQAPYNTLATTRDITILCDGDHAPQNLLLLYRAMQYAVDLGLTFAVRADVPALTTHTYVHPGSTAYRLGLHPCPPCAEEIGTETLLRIAESTGAKLHLQLVSTAESVRIIRRAKERGVQVTAEVALHHLLYTHEDIGDYNTVYKTIPPLRDKIDCEALLEGVKDGTIDCIVSAHTPCTPFAKKQDFINAPEGMVGLDTMLPALYTKLVKPGLLSWEELVQACCVKPALIARPWEQEEGATCEVPLLLFDPTTEMEVDETILACGTLNTPLLGETLCGKVTLPLQ